MLAEARCESEMLPPLCCADRLPSGDIDQPMPRDRIEGSGFHVCQSEVLLLKAAYRDSLHASTSSTDAWPEN